MTRLFELCCPESLSNVEDADSKFLSNLESTKWLSWISKVLQISLESAESIVKFNDVIILQGTYSLILIKKIRFVTYVFHFYDIENESRDTSCLIGSVAQIILDARFRTVTGFFSLIQKDWISTGHPFHSNYMHSSPIFLLFLDSVYQLLHQNPFEFEFNETLLTDVWDSCFDPTTGTFQFDTPSQRKTLVSFNSLLALLGIRTDWINKYIIIIQITNCRNCVRSSASGTESYQRRMMRKRLHPKRNLDRMCTGDNHYFPPSRQYPGVSSIPYINWGTFCLHLYLRHSGTVIRSSIASLPCHTFSYGLPYIWNGQRSLLTWALLQPSYP